MCALFACQLYSICEDSKDGSAHQTCSVCEIASLRITGNARCIIFSLGFITCTETYALHADDFYQDQRLDYEALLLLGCHGVRIRMPSYAFAYQVCSRIGFVKEILRLKYNTPAAARS